MALSMVRKQHFAAVGTKVNARFFESVRTDRNVRTFNFDDTAELQFVRYTEYPHLSNGYKRTDEDYFAFYIAGIKDPLWSGFINRNGRESSNGVRLSDSGVCDVCRRITTLINLFIANDYKHIFIQEKYHEWIKVIDDGMFIEIRLALGGDCCYLAIDNGDGYRVHRCKLQAIIDNQNWFCKYISF